MTWLRRVSVTVLVSLGVALQVPGLAAGSTTQTYNLSERANYWCVGPCASAQTVFVAGNVQSPGGAGLAREGLVGQVLDYNPDTNCLDQQENWQFSARGGQDTLTFSTTSDTFCFTTDPNVNIETGAFVITGGTGQWAGASGDGSFVETVLTRPQNATGTITLNLTL